MRRRPIVALLLAVCVFVSIVVYFVLARRNAGPSDLVAYLPTAGASVLYMDVHALRESGILATMTGAKTAEEPDYLQFVRETRFDYRQDLDTIAVALKDGRIYFALRGRFHWDDLRAYAAHEGGSCHNNYCVAPGSQPDRRISFYALKPDLMALAVSSDEFAAYQVARQSGKSNFSAPKDPVWAFVPAAALEHSNTMPAVAKAYVPALKSAEQIIFGIDADQNRQLELGIHVTCKDATAATALVGQLETITKALRDALAHQHQKPDPADLSGVLVAGTFRRDERQVYGAWPIPKAFVEAITGGVY